MGMCARKDKYEVCLGVQRNLIVIVLLLLPALAVALAEDQDPLHTDLRKHLFTGYDKNILPIKTTNTTVDIAVGLNLIHIDSLQEGVLTASAWLRMVWNDYRLKWDKDKFGGVDVLRVYPGDLWLPDIELYNTKDYREFSLATQFRNQPSMALLYPDSEVLWVPPVDIKVICANFSFTAGPMDEQKCNIKLGSWTHHGNIINLTLHNNKEKMDLEDFYHSSSPYVVTRHMEGTRVVKKYDCCEEPYPSLNFRFALKRQFPAREDAKEQLLTNILGVAIAILVLLGTTTILAAAYFLKRGEALKEDNFKMMAQNSTESGNNLI